MSLLHNLLLLLVFLCTTCTADHLGEFCNTDTNISSSQISVNVDQLLAELVSKTAITGYIATSYGKPGLRVYGLAQCRGDVNSKERTSCMQDAAKQIRQRCSNQADARIWYDYCFLRYNIKNFTGEVDTAYGIYFVNPENVTDAAGFNNKLGGLLHKVRSKVVLAKNEGLGKGKTMISPSVTLYALVQCTRDISSIDCDRCLTIPIGNFLDFCKNRKGCRVLYSSCSARYELYSF